MAGAAQIFFDGVDHVLLSGAELFASVDEPPSDGQDAPPGCILFGAEDCPIRATEDLIFMFDTVTLGEISELRAYT